MSNQHSKRQVQPFFQVRHNCLIFYELPILKYSKNSKNLINPYSGKVTGGVQKRIKKAVDLLIQKSPKRIIYNPVIKKNHSFTLNFVTLTVSHPQNLKASITYKQLMKPFLRKCRNYTNGQISYIWKAELQKRGQIHYHLTTNQFLHLSWIRNTWNNLQRRNGYLDHYARIHKSYNANSTDVHAVYKVRDIAAYLGKYLSKKESDVNLDSKVWDCSKDLKIKRFAFSPDGCDESIVQQVIDRGEAEVIKLEHCTVIKSNNVKALLHSSIINQLQKHLA